ncbi:MAG TPA: DJ-1/PfpI family protein [Ktedonobacteraceae bacterium]
MSIAHKKVAILIESDYFENEIFYYQNRFLEENVDLHFLTRLWGNRELTFTGHEYRAPFVCHESFEGMDDATLDSYDALIVPSGMVADKLRFTTDIHQLAPATAFMQRAFARKHILKGFICHALWLLASAPELVRDRPLTCHNNLLGDVCNMGALYTDQDVVVDNDLITGRTGPLCYLFAHKIIELLATRTPPLIVVGAPN